MIDFHKIVTVHAIKMKFGNYLPVWFLKGEKVHVYLSESAAPEENTISDISVPEIIKVPVPILFHDYKLSFQFRSSSKEINIFYSSSVSVPYIFSIPVPVPIRN